MPVMSGTEVLEHIRKYDTDIAVIVATAYPTVDTAVASLKNQASDYVKKPMEPDQFLGAVRNALAKKGLSQDPEADLHRAIGRTIRDARKTQDLTLKQLARRTGLSVSLLSQIERAESSASISSLYKIASALQLRMGEALRRHLSGRPRGQGAPRLTGRGTGAGVSPGTPPCPPGHPRWRRPGPVPRAGEPAPRRRGPRG